jgi:hypothetical protein
MLFVCSGMDLPEGKVKGKAVSSVTVRWKGPPWAFQRTLHVILARSALQIGRDGKIGIGVSAVFAVIQPLGFLFS